MEKLGKKEEKLDCREGCLRKGEKGTNKRALEI